MKKALFLVMLATVFLTSCITIKIQPFGDVSMPKKAKVENNSVLHLKLSGNIEMYSATEGFSFFGGQTHYAHDLILKIRSAKTDKRITAIVLQPQGIDISRATLNELKTALIDFKDSGKKIYGYLDMGTDDDILLLSVADTVYMNPSASAGFVLSGVKTNMVFLKDLLDKLGVEAHIVRAGEFKGAGEPFTRTEMSDEMRSNFTILHQDRYEQMLTDFAQGYNISVDNVRAIFEEREQFIINMEDALSYGIVDEIMFFDSMLKKHNITDKQLVLHTRYSVIPEKRQRNNIAVVYMSGGIASGGNSNISSERFCKVFDEIMEDDKIKAVVLRVSSGGGSALESEILHSKIAELKERKPVIVSLGGTAASGGYYIVSNANYIFADPYTVTGSIGVFGMLLNLQGTAEKIGISFDSIGYGKFADAGNPFAPFDSTFADALQLSVLDTYNEFKTRVSEGRNMTMENVEAIAKGQVWSAQKALQYKLIDEIGTLDNAIEKAKELANIQSFSMAYYPEKKSFFDSFFSGFSVSARQMLQTKNLPDPLNKNADYYIGFIEEVLTHPIQMRSDFFLDND